MAEGNPSDTQSKKADSTGRLAENEFRFKRDNGMYKTVLSFWFSFIRTRIL